MISIGMVGCGQVVHTLYRQSLKARSAYGVRWVTDLNQAQADSAAQIFGAEAVSLDEIAKSADIVVISTPPSSHETLVKACLREGRTILCEKPFVTSYDAALRLQEAADESGTQLKVGHFRRTFPQLELARDLVAAGAVGKVEGFDAFEGGRFTWRSVSDYPVKDRHGGVLWDTGSHTTDMALFATGLDLSSRFEVSDVAASRDKAEPSHDYAAKFRITCDWGEIDGRLHVSRRDALPNFIRIRGDRGEVSFAVDLDDRVRLTANGTSTVMRATRTNSDLGECFDLQIQRVMTGRDSGVFDSRRFLGQARLLEELSNA